MAKIFLTIIIYVILLPVINILTMIYGWGINPASWGIIFSAYFVSLFLILILALTND